jgi:hypothetical protein
MRVNTAEDRPEEPQWRDGDLAGLTGTDILSAIRRGRLWLNLLNLTTHNVLFRDLTNRIYDEIEAISPGYKALRRSENLLISSPTTVVNYHVDPGPTVLWHIRGHKRIWVYPHHDEQVLKAADLERVCTREWEGWEIPYRDEFDGLAEIFELAPGDVTFWPQHSPHRVQNLDTFSVSLTTNHVTPQSFVTNAVYRVNGYSRRRFGRPLRSVSTSGPVAWSKVLASLAIRAGLNPVETYESQLSFRVDPDAPGGYVDIAGTD